MNYGKRGQNQVASRKPDVTPLLYPARAELRVFVDVRCPKSDLIAQEWYLRLCQPSGYSRFRKNTNFPLGRRSRSVKNLE